MPRRAVGIAPMTSAERQARRREQFRNMREALAEIEWTATGREARAIAAVVLDDVGRPAQDGGTAKRRATTAPRAVKRS